MEIIQDKETYFGWVDKMAVVPFTQSRGMYDFNGCDRSGRAILLVNKREDPDIACFAHIKRFCGLKMLLVEGECLKTTEPDEVVIRQFYEEITHLEYSMVEVNSSLPYCFAYDYGIRRAGYLKPVGLFSIYLTRVIELTKPFSFGPNWKKNLKKSAKFPLAFSLYSDITIERMSIFHQIYEELVSRKGFGTYYSLEMLLALCHNPHFRMAQLADEESGEIACSTLIYTHRTEAISILIVTTPYGRKVSASFLLHKKLFETLVQQGFEHYDWGRISPSISSKDSVAFFKMGIDSTPLMYGGEWSWYRHHWMRIGMYFVKKYLFKKIEI